jgi:flagellar basal-body rod protein FlgB
MAISDIPILSMLRHRMQWHQERQRVLAENVSNSDTPGFRARDLREPDFRNTMAAASGGVQLARSDPGHFGSSEGSTRFQLDRSAAGDVRPAGNAVNLEEEMMKVAQNQMDYQAATALYGRSLGLLKTALGKR